MEVPTAQPPSVSDSSSAASYPQWVILERHCKTNVGDSSSSSSSCPPAAAVAKTLAAARTSDGHPIQVSLSLQDPPATSAVRVEFPDGACRPRYCVTVASHGGSLLIEVEIERWCDDAESSHDSIDQFVYNAGDAAAAADDPPSLLLLPRYYPSEGEHGYTRYPVVNRSLLTDCTGILRRRRRRGDDADEVVVAELQMVPASEDDPRTRVAELFLFSSGQWTLKRPRIRYGDDGELGSSSELASRWRTTGAFPVGDTTLCWTDVTDGALFCHAQELEEQERPWLQYVPLPKVPSPCCGRNVCATTAAAGGGGAAVKFVNVFPRCCCGGAGATACQRSRHAYTVQTWTLLRMDGGGGGGVEMEWVMDGGGMVVDATELWSQDVYRGLPRVPLGHPFVSMYEPHVICFVLCEAHHVKAKYGGDTTLWLLMVDMRSKTIRSVSRNPDLYSGRDLMISNISYYLNPHQTCSKIDDIEKKKMKREDKNVKNSMMLQTPCKSAVEPPAAPQACDEILAAFREIPSYGLSRDDVLKAFLVLSGDDNGCRIRSLLRLPKNLRKDWLLMKINKEDR